LRREIAFACWKVLAYWKNSISESESDRSKIEKKKKKGNQNDCAACAFSIF
jgi:hypothetical protein